MAENYATDKRIIIVSNRLPFTVVQNGSDIQLEASGGGLVSGLSSWLQTLHPDNRSSYTWVGWPGTSISDENRSQLETIASSRLNAHPVYLSDEEMENFYQGFCNRTIWPLFHYFPSYAAYNDEYWSTYTRVNREFCEAVAQIYRPGDIIWVHDYHLMLLPGLLRERLPEAPIGFFLHIPFPSYELFRALPAEWGEGILEGLLGADLVGFHAHDYTEHFFRAVERFLGHKRTSDYVTIGNRVVKADTFPMGIDYERYSGAAQSPEAQQERSRLRRTLGDAKVILSIDRLDYTKGIINRLQGYSLFLEQNPEWHEKVALALVVTPSRVGVQHYMETKRQIETLVGTINGRFGHMSWVPIRYQYRFVPLVALAALYGMSDIALVTPLRDGMNLIAKEYLASRTDGTGVLILSTLAGASEELTEAVLINPNSRQEIADAIKRALNMPLQEQVQRNRAMQELLRRYDVTPWAQRFIRELLELNRLQARRSEEADRSPDKAEARGKSARRPLLIYSDRTFVPVPKDEEDDTGE